MRLLLTLSLLALATPALAENRFVARGAPAPDREWNGADYTAFAKVVRESGTVVPLFSDPEGREVLARAVNHENFAFYRNAELPLGTRLQSMLEFQKGLNGVLLTYANLANSGTKVSRELAELMAMTLHTAAMMFELVDELLRTPVEEAQREQREAGLRQMRNGLTQVLSGAEVSLSERNFYSGADLGVMLRAIAETLPRLKPHLSDNQVAELRGRFERRRRDFKEPGDLRHFDTILRTLAPASPATKKS